MDWLSLPDASEGSAHVARTIGSFCNEFKDCGRKSGGNLTEMANRH